MNANSVWATPYARSWRSHHREWLAHADILHVVVADTDATYGAHVAAENNTWAEAKIL